jgi:hypothetical protein
MRDNPYQAPEAIEDRPKSGRSIRDAAWSGAKLGAKIAFPATMMPLLPVALDGGAHGPRGFPPVGDPRRYVALAAILLIGTFAGAVWGAIIDIIGATVIAPLWRRRMQ